MASVRFLKFIGGNSDNKAKACGLQCHVYLPSPLIKNKIKTQSEGAPPVHKHGSAPKQTHFIINTSSEAILCPNPTSSHKTLQTRHSSSTAVYSFCILKSWWTKILVFFHMKENFRTYNFIVIWNWRKNQNHGVNLRWTLIWQSDRSCRTVLLKQS